MSSRNRTYTRRSRKKDEKKQTSLFHLDEPEPAQIAKNELHFYTEYSENPTSFTKNDVCEAWLGENIDLLATYTSKTPQHSSHQTLNKNRRQLLKSADLRAPRKITQFSAKKTIPSFNNIDSKSLPVAPRQQNLVTSVRESTTTSHIFKMRSKSRLDRNKSDEREKHEKSREKFKIAENLGIEGNGIKRLTDKFDDFYCEKKEKRGVLNNTFKHKQNKKRNLIGVNKRTLAFSKIENFGASNEPLKRELNKIINLIREEKNFK